MSKKNYRQIAEEVTAAVGGKSNVVDVTNCMTRLRFVLKDDAVVDEKAVKGVDGVKGVMNKGGQYQVIIGTHVSEVVKDVRQVLGIVEDAGGSAANEKTGSLYDRFFKTISGCIMPMIGPMIAGGIIKGILILCTTFGLLTNESGTYLLLYAAADAILHFMPIIVGFSAGRIFGSNPYTTAAIGAAFVYPTLVAAFNEGVSLTFLGLPVTIMSYASTLFPILLAAYFASVLEKLLKRVIPEMVQLMFVPTIVLMVTVPISWLVIGPVMNTVSSVLSGIVFGVFNFSPIIGGLLFGAFWQLVVLLGLHSAFIPILINNIVTVGFDPVNAVLGLTVWALAGVSLGYALKMKNKEQRATAFGGMASCLCGVTEPTIYSIVLPQVKLFVCAWIGGGIAGGILGALGGKMYSFGGDGLFRIPSMINPEGLDVSFYGFIACALLALVVSAVLSFFVAKQEPVDAP